MTNTINPPDASQNRVDMWQIPAGFDGVDDNTTEIQQYNYTNFISDDLESRTVESGRPLAPIREGGNVSATETLAPADQLVGHVDREDRLVDPQAAEDVLATANRVVDDAFAAMPEAQAERARQEHHRQANERAAVYGPRIEMLRDGVLNEGISQREGRDTYELAA